VNRNQKVATPLALAASMLLAAASAGQESTVDDYQFSEVIDVQLVNVEVWVTDSKGRPVSGLTVDDFEILEDGKSVSISYFAEVREDLPVEPSLERELASPASPSRKPQIPVVDPSHLVVYFDQLHLLPASRRQAIRDLREFLAAEGVPPERILILSQAEGLRTEASFGSSWKELDEALERVGKANPLGGLMESQKRLAIRNLEEQWTFAQEIASGRQGGDAASANDDACETFLRRAVPRVEAYAAERRSRIAVTLEHLASASSFLTGIPGMKTMLFVSDALERAPGADLVAYINDLCPVQTRTPMFLLSDELSQEFRNLTRHANANRVTIYPLQTQGLRPSALGGAEQTSVDFRAGSSFETALRLAAREGLVTLATETGGRAILNRNQFGEALTDVAREMSSYYSLAYEPPRAGDGREHQIDVELASKELRARHRRGYRDKSSDQRMTERLQAAVYLGLVDNPLGVRLGAGEVTSGGGDKVVLPLHILVPAESIVFLPSDEGVVAQLSVQVSTRNTKDQKGIFDHRAYRLTWQTESDEELIGLVMDLEVPPGVHLVAVGVRDDATREASFVSTTLEIHDRAPGGTSSS
jgi:VWFA-related protein